MRKVLYILGKLNDPDIDWMVETGARTTISAGTLLIEEGRQVESIYIVLEGLLKVSSMGKSLGTLASGEIVGELSFLDSRPPAATVTATEDCLLLAIARSSLQAKLERDVGFAARFYHALGVFLADRLRSTVSRLGYGETKRLQAQVEYEDELDEDLLDDLSLAGSRFDWMLQRLKGH